MLFEQNFIVRILNLSRYCSHECSIQGLESRLFRIIIFISTLVLEHWQDYFFCFPSLFQVYLTISITGEAHVAGNVIKKKKESNVSLVMSLRQTHS